MRAAIAAHDAGADVVIVSKRGSGDAHTVLAAGGINAALGTVDSEDSWQQHFADTMIEGYFLSDPTVVEIMAREASGAIEELAGWGCEFARTADGHLDQRFFGAHRYRRTCYAGDWTGRAIVATLGQQVTQRQIPVIEDVYVTELLVDDGVCFGAYAFDLKSGSRTVFLADAVVLAAGGHTRLWRRSSSRRDENFGDGMALALRAGARLADMELVQFHPTGMVKPEEMAGTLVTEAVRGEGGHLLNALGERFMERYDAVRMELSTRDRVALANYREIAEGRGTPNGGVLLDITHIPKDVIIQKLPRMYRQFLDSQLLDISQNAMEVAPTAHYSMGGVVVDPETHATEVEGLYAVGEVTSGLHGANRLGGNSLVETVVFGRRAGDAAATRALALDVSKRAPQVVKRTAADVDSMIKPGSEFARPLQRALRDTMWEQCGVVRTEDGLRKGLSRIEELKAASADIDVRPSSEGYADLAQALDLKSGLIAAEATRLGAIERRETRGAHNRLDYPSLDPSLAVNFQIRLGSDNKLALESRPVPEMLKHLQAWVDNTEEMAVAGRLLE